MLFFKSQLTEIDEQWYLLRDEEKRHSAAFGKLITERQIPHSVLKCYFDLRGELNPKIHCSIAARVFFEGTAKGEQRVTGSPTACHPRVFFLWPSVFAPGLCWSREWSAKHW